MRHIISATTLTTGEQLAMCGHVFASYDVAVAAGHPVGNYLPQQSTRSAYRVRGVDCEACVLRHGEARV